LLADKHDSGGPFTHIKRKYGPNVVKGASGSVNAALSLKAFTITFGCCYPIPDMSHYLPDQLPVNNNLARPFTEGELRNAIALTISWNRYDYYNTSASSQTAKFTFS